MFIKKFDYLPDAARNIRSQVFEREQGFCNEFDKTDESCAHILVLDGDRAVATVRYFFDCEKGSYIIGRIAVIEEYRGRGVGAKIVEAAEAQIKAEGGGSVILNAQCRAAGFYEKLGYAPFGETEHDEYCPHIWMKKEL